MDVIIILFTQKSTHLIHTFFIIIYESISHICNCTYFSQLVIVIGPEVVYNFIKIQFFNKLPGKDLIMYYTHEMVYIQDVKHYQNGSTWTGSHGRLRFRCSPSKDENDKTNGVQVEIWFSNLCYELSQVAETHVFDLTDDGIREAELWLEEKAKAVDN